MNKNKIKLSAETGLTIRLTEEGIEINGQKLPDPKKHQLISFIKSFVRILGYCFLPYSLVTATIVLIFSEIIGIIEELV